MLGETLVEKLDDAVCCRVCHPVVTFFKNVNCKSCILSNREVYCYPTTCICDGRSLLDRETSTRRLLRGFQSAFLSHLLTSFGSRQLD